MGHTHIPRSGSNANGVSESARSISDALEQQLKGVISVILDLTEACVSASSDMLASGDEANAAKVRAQFVQITACLGLTFPVHARTPNAFDNVEYKELGCGACSVLRQFNAPCCECFAMAIVEVWVLMRGNKQFRG